MIGAGKLTTPPAFLAPTVEVTFTPIIAEKITQAFSVYLSCTDWGPNGYRAGRRYIVMTDASGNVIDQPSSFIVARTGGGKGMDKLSFSGGLSADGVAYSIASTWAPGCSVMASSIRRSTPAGIPAQRSA